jgi:hypothetical protein
VIATAPESPSIAAHIAQLGTNELLPEQAGMSLPFEGMGVAGSWIFSMPKAGNAFDYSTIADVEFAIDYSTMYSDECYRQVSQRMNASRRFEGECAFSVRHHF